MPVRLTYEWKGLAKAGLDMEALERRSQDMAKPIGETLKRVVKRTNLELASGQHGVQSRHGTSGLAGSFTFLTEPLAGSIGSNKAYAAQLQFGGTIYPKKAKMLTIPIGENVGATGDPKYATALSVPDGRFWRSPKTNALFIVTGGKRKMKKYKKFHKGRWVKLAEQLEAAGLKEPLRLWFLLVRSVTQVAHNYLYWSEPGDTNIWNRFARDWLLRGK